MCYNKLVGGAGNKSSVAEMAIRLIVTEVSNEISFCRGSNKTYCCEAAQ